MAPKAPRAMTGLIRRNLADRATSPDHSSSVTTSTPKRCACYGSSQLSTWCVRTLRGPPCPAATRAALDAGSMALQGGGFPICLFVVFDPPGRCSTLCACLTVKSVNSRWPAPPNVLSWKWTAHSSEVRHPAQPTPRRPSEVVILDPATPSRHRVVGSSKRGLCLEIVPIRAFSAPFARDQPVQRQETTRVQTQPRHPG
jgi:hypothetical protein